MSRALLLLALLGCTPAIDEGDTDTDAPADTDETDEVEPVVLADDLDLDRMLGHLDVLQGIADANDGTRLHLSQGYVDSVDYVVDHAEGLGFTVQVETYPLTRTVVLADEVALVAPEDAAATLTTSRFQGSGSSTVEAPLVPVDLVLPPNGPANTSTSGCEAADFEGFPAGAVALLQRGSCTFAVKVDNAVAAGASAVLVFNEGQPGRRDLLQGVVSTEALADVAVLGLSYASGERLAGLSEPVVAVDVQVQLVEGDDRNVLVDIPGADPSRTLLVGAHLDSVLAGPGINDNGSGTAFLLELATLAAAGWTPETNVRLAFWGAEEIGLVGSRYHFVDGEGPNLDNLDTVEAYLNFDMMASPNGARFIYDGDGSNTEQDIANPGSIAIEGLFEAWFADRDQATAPVSLVTRSDSYWAVVLGLPWGGLFSGAEVPKSPAHAEAFGGEAGLAYDPCYHLACDDRANIDAVLYEDLGRAGAHVVQTLAESEAPLWSGSALAPGDGPWLRDEVRTDLPVPTGCHGEVLWRQ